MKGKQEQKKLKFIFKPLNIDQQVVNQFTSYSKVICSKAILEEEVYFKCYTCQNEQDNQVICQDCFKNSDHQGHKIIYFNQGGGGSCDCGREEEGGRIFCKFHSPQNKIDKTQYIQAIPKNIQQQIIQYVDSNYTQVFTMIDKGQILAGNQYLQLLLQNLMQIQQSCAPFGILVADLYQKPLSNFICSHDCNVINKNQTNQQKCTCSILENLFRYCTSFDEQNSQLLYQAQLDLYFEQSFVNYSTKVYTKMIESIPPFKEIPLQHLIYQFQFSDNLEEMMSNKQFGNFLRQQLVNLYNDLIIKEYNEEKINIIFRIINLFHFILQHRCYTKVWSTHFEFIIEFIKIISLSQPHNCVDVNSAQSLTIIDKSILDIFIEIVKRVFALPENNEILIKSLLAAVMNECILPRNNANFEKTKFCSQLNNKKGKKTQNKTVIPIFDNSLRTFSILLVQLIIQKGYEQTKNLIQEYLEGKAVQMQSIFEQIIAFQSNKLYYVVSEQSQSLEQNDNINFYFLNNNMSFVLEQFYKSSSYLLYECDFALLQLSLLFVDPSKIIQRMKQGMNINIDETDQQQKQKNIQILLLNLVQLNIDEKPLVNVAIALGQQDLKWVNRSIQSVIKNCFVISSIHTNQSLNKLIKYFITEKLDLNKIVQEVADYNIEQQKFLANQKIIKEKMHEPYIWNKLNRQHYDFLQNIQEKCTKDEQYDTILGNQVQIIDSELPQNEKQDNIFYQISAQFIDLQKSLTNLLIFNQDTQMDLTKCDNENVRLMIKLLHVLLIRNYEQIIQNQELSQIYNQSYKCILSQTVLLSQKDIDIEKSLKVVQQIILKVSQNQQQQLQFDKDVDSEIQSKIQDKQKEAILKKREEAKLKALLQIQMQQQKFQEKNQELANKVSLDEGIQNNNENNIKSNEICLICQQIGKQDNFLVAPCYISEDNLNQFYLQGCKKVGVTYQIQSCSHYMHLQCHQQQFAKQKNIQKNKQQLILEYCQKCKFHSNHFLIYSKSIIIKDNLSKESWNLDSQQILLEQEQELGKDSSKQMLSLVQEIIKNSDFSEASSIRSIKEEIEKQYTLTELNDFNNQFKSFCICFDAQNIKDQSHFFQEVIQNLLERSFAYSLKEFFNFKHFEILRNLIFTIKYLQPQLTEMQKDQYTLSKAAQTEKFDQCIQQLINSNSFSFDSIWIYRSTYNLLQSKGNEQLLFKVLKSYSILFMNYLLIFYINLIIRNKNNKQSQSDKEMNILSDIQSLIKYYNSDTELQRQVSLFLLPYIRLLVMTLTCFSSSIDEKEIAQLNKEFKDDDQELKILNNFLKVDFTQLNIQLIQSDPLFWNTYYQSVQKLCELEQFKKNLTFFLTKNPCIKFQIVALNHSYMDMHRQYFFNMCILCKFLPSYEQSDLCVCLICGETYCSFLCQRQKIYSKDILGNLNNHAKDAHCGTSVFMNIQTTELIYVNFPLAIQTGILYANQIGKQITKTPNVDWNSYELKKQQIFIINDLLFNHRIPQHIFYSLQSNKMDLKYYIAANI